MAQISDEEYEAEKKRVTRYHGILEIRKTPLVTSLSAGVV